MDVIFETLEGSAFSIEVWFFSTVLEMKEKIQKYHGFPVTRQRLVFDGRVMEDERDTEYYGVLHGSRIRLFLDSPTDPTASGASDRAAAVAVKAEQQAESKVRVQVRNLATRRQLTVELDAAVDTAAQLRERVQEAEGIPVGRFGLFLSGVELQDNRVLADYGVADLSEVTLAPRALPSSAAGASGPAPNKKMRVMVLPKSGTKKIPVEVNGGDNVSELRRELQRLQARLGFELPTEGYFFIYKQNVMDEDRSFRWHDVRPGDTIEIFNGSVTGGT
ncbi:hypothetical protein Taro_046177 [Colocasia esculenta]|uniref:Ubiquitin-like domain-containing protein n=1 Tax=Colocasia esculenta TaxID=4460 RepID=A0A843WRK0_COLES|nr:hypothetical protein [Colocasia esculenta]